MSGWRRWIGGGRACAALLAAAVVGGGSAPVGQPDGALVVRTVRFGGATYLVAEADMRRVKLRMLHRGGAITSYGAAEAALRARGERMLLATNGGLFHGGLPIGLHYEDGARVTPLDLDTRPPPGRGGGNYYSLPNAVLFQDRAGRVAIRESTRMRGLTGSVRDGLQSGPALLLDGDVHRIARSPNVGVPHDRRAAACVLGGETLVIVFARGRTTFPQLARFRREELRCRDALFLDANVPGIYLPGRGVNIPPIDFAGILALTVPA
ncbi:MAG TPA: phosphodiester glycosidase family protein [Longimicrobium sp.]|nr:phosphodiester glycosidase family protein [Longimicrobium sp.]